MHQTIQSIIRSIFRPINRNDRSSAQSPSPHQDSDRREENKSRIPKTTCSICGKRLALDTYFDIRHVICNDCADQRERERQAERARRVAEKQARKWEEFCPENYRLMIADNEPTKLASRIASAKSHAIVCGPPGTAKTVAALCSVRSQLECRGSGVLISDAEFCRCCSEAAHDTDPSFIQNLCRCAILVYDDLGKGRHTPRNQTDLLDLIEARISHRRRTIITTNWLPVEFFKSFDIETREPLRRRIKDYFTLIET